MEKRGLTKIKSFIKEYSEIITLVITISGGFALLTGDSFKKLYYAGIGQFFGIDILIYERFSASYYILIFIMVFLIIGGAVYLVFYHDKMKDNDEKQVESIMLEEVKIIGMILTAFILIFYQTVFNGVSIQYLDFFKHRLIPFFGGVVVVILLSYRVNGKKLIYNFLFVFLIPVLYIAILYFLVYPFEIYSVLIIIIANLCIYLVILGIVYIPDHLISRNILNDKSIDSNIKKESSIISIINNKMGLTVILIITILMMLLHSMFNHLAREIGYNHILNSTYFTAVYEKDEKYIIFDQETYLIGFKIGGGEDKFIEKGKYEIIEKIGKKYKLENFKLQPNDGTIKILEE